MSRFTCFLGDETLKVQFVELLLATCFELLPNLVMSGVGCDEFCLFCIPFFFQFMCKILSAPCSFEHLGLSIADELDAGQASAGVWCHQILLLLEFLDGFEEFVNAVRSWFMPAVQVEQIALKPLKFFFLFSSACRVTKNTPWCILQMEVGWTSK